MLVLTLFNFKCWKNKEVIFPDYGLVLLDGVSGSGKTSILEAIYFVLYGKGTRLVFYGEKKCQVTLKTDQYTINRQKGPNKLVFTTRGITHEDNIAQEIINNKFGSNFLLTSYMVQKNNESFLKLGPTDKMLFLEQFIKNGEKITKLKKIVKNGLKESKDELISKTSELKIIEEEFKDIPKLEKIKCPNIDLEILENNKKACTNKIDSYTSKLSENKLSKAEYEKKKEMYNRVSSYKLDLEKQLGKITVGDVDNINNKIHDLEGKLKNYNDNKLYLEKRKQYELNLKRFRDFINDEERKNKKDKLEEQLNNIRVLDEKDLKKKYNDLLEFLKIKGNIKQLEEEINNISIIKDKEEKKNLEEKIEDINGRMNVQKCPHCDNSVLILRNKVVKTDKLSITNDEIKNKDLFHGKIKQIDSNISKYTTTFSMLEKYHEQLKKINTTGLDISDIKNKIEINESNIILKYKLTKQLELINEQDEAINTLKNNLLNDKRELEELKKNIPEDVIENSVTKELNDLLIKRELNINNIQQKKQLETSIELINKELTDIKITDVDFNIEINTLSSKIDKYHKILKKYTVVEERLKQYKEYLSHETNYNKWKDKYNSSIESEKLSSNKVSLYDRLLFKILETESVVTTNIIDNINFNIKYYLDQFFDDEIEITINPFKEMKKGNKPSVNISVFYKNEVFDLSNLSGGERDRVELSFMLTLNSLFNSELLLLDECISSLDQELCNKVLNTLKHSKKNKLIIVTLHQVNKGVFDEVISFN